MKFLLLALFVVLISNGCGVSPLLQHEKEKKASSERTAGAVQPFTTLDFNSRFTGRVYWLENPLVGKASFRFVSAEPIREFDAWAEMPDMGHGTTPFSFRKITDLEFVVDDVWFTMSGRWVVYIEVNGSASSLEISLQ